MVFVDPHLEVSLIAIVLSSLSQVVQFTFGNKREMMKHQAKMKEKQKKINELAKSSHPGAKKELEQAQNEMLESMQAVMQNMSRTMIFSLVIFVPAFFVLGSLYTGLTFGLPIPIPWLSPEFDLLNPVKWFSLYTQTNFLGWYALNSIIFSLVIINPLVKLYEKRKEENKNANAR